jgi:hypothetical protein
MDNLDAGAAKGKPEVSDEYEHSCRQPTGSFSYQFRKHFSQGPFAGLMEIVSKQDINAKNKKEAVKGS